MYLKRVKIVNVLLCIFCHNLKNQWSKAKSNFTKAVKMWINDKSFYIRFLLKDHPKFSWKALKCWMGHFRKLQMCSLKELLDMCSSLESMVQTNYDSELGSHSISNTHPDFFPGPGIGSWIRTTNIQNCSVAPDLLVLRNQPICNLQKKCIILALQQDSRCKAGASAKSQPCGL